MLGLGGYVWDKRCPSGKRCIPPVYGRFNSTYIKVPENSPRINGGDQAEAVSTPWKAGIPRGNDVCIKNGFKGKDATPLKKRIAPKQDYRHQSQREISTKNKVDNLSCKLPSHFSPPTPSSSFTSQSLTGCNRGKQFYNVMWDPKIARGPTLVSFDEAQAAKWKRQVDAERATQVRKQMRRRRRKMKELEYLDTRGNPMRQIVYPSVTLKKEPLTKFSYEIFLTEQCEPVEKISAGQITDVIRAAPPRCGKAYTYGIAAGVQTESENNNSKKEETEDWISSTMIEKIPQQAILELQEEADLELVASEQKRYELVFLYRKWQEMKESQWNEWNRAWNEIRMREIMDQDAYLQEQQGRVMVIGFCKNAISACFQRTFEGMKQDGFINEHGVPYEELKEINECLDYQNETEKYYEGKQLLARKVVDSALINAAVQRFSAHMNDEFGWPHGVWLSKRERHSSIAYDKELKKYLEGRWAKRRELNSTTASTNALFSETSLLNIFDFYKHSKRAIAKTQPVLPTVNEEPSVLIENVISKQRLGRRTVRMSHVPHLAKTGEDKEHGHRTSSNSDDISMLYRRNTRWSTLEMLDHAHHDHHDQQQENVSSSRNKFGEPDGESEMRRSKELQAKADSGRRRPSHAPHTRFQ